MVGLEPELRPRGFLGLRRGKETPDFALKPAGKPETEFPEAVAAAIGFVPAPGALTLAMHLAEDVQARLDVWDETDEIECYVPRIRASAYVKRTSAKTRNRGSDYPLPQPLSSPRDVFSGHDLIPRRRPFLRQRDVVPGDQLVGHAPRARGLGLERGAGREGKDFL